jgi:hypothetical protein
MVENRIPSQIIEHLLAVARRDVTQFIHDVGDSGDPNDTTQPLAHAAVLVRYLNRMLTKG